MAAALVNDLDARPGRQALDRLGEIEAIDLADKGDNVAARRAREAVPETASRRDMERRGLFLVERAQALQGTAAGAAQLEVLPDHFGDERAGADEFDVLVPDPAWHVRESSPGSCRAALVTSRRCPCLVFLCSGTSITPW